MSNLACLHEIQQGHCILFTTRSLLVHQSCEEMEVLFTLPAERHEPGSVLLTSILPFSKWE